MKLKNLYNDSKRLELIYSRINRYVVYTLHHTTGGLTWQKTITGIFNVSSKIYNVK